MNNSCPCPNPTCPNHGDCAKCTGSHVRKGYLSYCAFYTILPAIRNVIETAPDSTVARQLEALIQPQIDAYEVLKKKHGLSQEELDLRLAEIARSN